VSYNKFSHFRQNQTIKTAGAESNNQNPTNTTIPSHWFSESKQSKSREMGNTAVGPPRVSPVERRGHPHHDAATGRSTVGGGRRVSPHRRTQKSQDTLTHDETRCSTYYTHTTGAGPAPGARGARRRRPAPAPLCAPRHAAHDTQNRRD
jgi:hypothetical protein